tara:strand:- start:2730 stop:4478 length:1749 start_codon:yes stop_codon:yes gene_type:complete
MSLDISGGINNSNNAITKISELGVNTLKDKLNDLFDIENPDGVHAQLRTRNDENSLKSSNEEDSSLNIAARKGEPAQENRGTRNSDVFYNQDVDSYKHKDANGDANITLGKRPYSVFNKYSLVNFRGTPIAMEGSKNGGKSEFYNKIDQTTLVNPTASKIIELTDACGSNGYKYQYSDFAMAKYFGKIPNNMMVTLRRFTSPAPDDIISPSGLTGANTQEPDIARAVTWLGESSGNQLSAIMNFSHGFEWKNAEAEVQALQSQNKASGGKVGGIINNNKVLKAASNAASGRTAEQQKRLDNGGAGFDSFSNTYPNHVFGPLNVIKKVLVRQQGLEFNQEFKLKFEYELRDLGGANPKILMLDQLANILALTYNNAPFWGGDVRYIGDGSVARPLGKLGLLKSGDFGGYMKSVVSDLTGKDTGSTWKNLTEGVSDFVSGDNIQKTVNNLLSGSLMDMFNSPQGGQAVAALLSGDPTGQWHVTIGNPLNPIAVIGNLACTNTAVNFEGPMGLQDFPEKLVVEITLKPARPRDKAEIESMFNSGRGRFYIQPADEIDINATIDVNAYGKTQKSKLDSELRKYSNG